MDSDAKTIAGAGFSDMKRLCALVANYLKYRTPTTVGDRRSWRSGRAPLAALLLYSMPSSPTLRCHRAAKARDGLDNFGA